MKHKYIIKDVGLINYSTTLKEMQYFTSSRSSETHDELWIVEHYPVFSQGRHGKPEHIISNHKDIPIIQSDRGGQVTYHGPGQAIIYFMMDLKKLGIGIKDLVCKIEKTTIKLLKLYNIEAHLIEGAPGVYVSNKKIASLGLRVKHGKTYHGLSINVDMDLTPFSYINPCGYKNLEICQISDFIPNISMYKIHKQYISLFTGS